MSYLKYDKPEADWPLASKDIPKKMQESSEISNLPKFDIANTDSFWNHKTPKLDVVANKKITIVVEKGTKRITQFLNQISEENSIRQYSSEKHICDTCSQEIGSNISRTLVMCDKDGGPRFLCFHFFFPCWDFQLLVQKYPNLIIDKTGFSIPETIPLKIKSIKDMQNNLDFWK